MAKKRQTISGLKDLAHNLERLSDELRERDTNYATRQGALNFQAAAKARAPVDTGKLRDNIVVRKDRNTIFDSEYFVGIRRVGSADNPRNAFYAYFVEYGHDTRPTTADKGRRKHRAGLSSRTVPAQPFMRSAWEAERDNAIKTFRDRVARRIRLRGKQGHLG